jgi:hypothetical protein
MSVSKKVVKMSDEENVIKVDCPFCTFKDIMKFGKKKMLNVTCLLIIADNGSKSHVIDSNYKLLEKENFMSKSASNAMLYAFLRWYQKFNKKIEGVNKDDGFEYDEDEIYFHLSVEYVYTKEMVEDCIKENDSSFINAEVFGVKIHCHKH